MRSMTAPRSAPGAIASAVEPPIPRRFPSEAILPAAAAIFALFVFLSSVFGLFRVDAVITTGQGAPLGSAVIVTPESATALHAGQWISYTPPEGGSTVIRPVSEVRHALGHTVATASGGNLVMPRTVWVADLSIPFIGWLIAVARIAIIQILILLLLAAVAAGMARSFILGRRP